MSGISRPKGATWEDGFTLPTEQWRGAWLTVLGGDARGKTYRLGERVTLVGRMHNNHVQLVEAGVSRNHAQIIPSAGRYEIRDMNSTAGTFVNGQRVEEMLLPNGADIKVGTVRLRFEADASHPVDHGLARKNVDRETRKTTDYVDTNQVGGAAQKSLRDRLSVLAQISQVAGEKADRATKLNAIGAALVSQLEADRVLFLAGSGAGWALEAHVARAGLDPVLRKTVPHRKLMSQVVATGTAIRSAHSVPGNPNSGAALCVPVFGPQLVGLVYADRLSNVAVEFDDDEVAFAAQVAGTLGLLK